jgi:hypothetical protein
VHQGRIGPVVEQSPAAVVHSVAAALPSDAWHQDVQHLAYSEDR